jgi:hypothetical protein
VSKNPFQELVIEEFLEGHPRADEWKEWKNALDMRLRDAIATRDSLPTDSPQRGPLEERIAELREQVVALMQEAVITEFVEDSVRASLSRPRRAGAPGSPGTIDEFDLDEAGYG